MSPPERRAVIPLGEVTSVEEAGVKAATLADLARHGIPVPETVVVPPDAAGVPGRELLDALGGCVAVRSSATAEDLADASFAGQFRSVLHVATPDALARAIQECRASTGSPAVAAYCAARGLDASAIRMAVMVQRMLRAEVAGALFTVHPVRGREDEMLIEACEGVADELLAGRCSGVQILVRDGAAPAPVALLSPEQATALARLGRRIQALRGAPQDIEWAIEGGRLYVLQARPITRLGFAGIEGQWTNADFRDGGVSSDVVGPLVWSLYERALQRALTGFLADVRLLEREFEATRVFYGRPYWNLGAVKRCARRLPGFVEREFDRDLAVQPTYAGDGARTPVGVWTLVRAIPTLLAAGGTLRRQQRRDRALLAATPAAPAATRLRDLDDARLLERWTALVDGTHLVVEENYFRTIFCTSIAKQEVKSLLADRPVSYAALVGGLGGLTHFRCAQALWEVGNGGPGSLASFLARYGYHSRRELDLRVPRWSEEPEFVAELARGLRETESPAARQARQQARFAEECARTRGLFGAWRRGRFEAKLGRLRACLWLREEMRDRATRVYALIRRHALEIGRRAAAAGRLDDPTDVFYLTFREVSRVLRCPMRAHVEARRAHERGYRNFRAPNEVGRGFRAAPVDGFAQRLTGIGCSSGRAAGPVAVVTDLRDATKVARGDVLVCPYTDPSWTPLLSAAAAVVTENGGLLSHAAVICREYGIPAVLNVPAVTRRLRDGQRVRVDGEEGHVDLLE